jgi:hypothetical protein
MAAGNAYSAADLAKVLVDDMQFTRAQINHTVGNTGRASHLWRYEGVPESIVSPLSFLNRYAHLITGGLQVHQHRLYLWNDDSSAWELLGSTTNANDPRNISGTKTTGLDQYVNASGEIFALLWDYEGVYQSPPGGGCLHADTLVTVASNFGHEGDALTWDESQVPARDVRYADQVVGPDGPVKVEETTYHFPAPSKMIRVVTDSGLSYFVTADHWCPVAPPIEDGEGITWKLAAAVEVGDLIPDILGDLRTVASVDASEVECELVDIFLTNPPTRVATYSIGGGLLTCNMAEVST